MSSESPTPLCSQTINGFLDSLESKAPTPGGGAAAAITGATAASTAGMVLSYSVDKKSLAEHKEHNLDAQKQLNRARVMFLTLADEDAAGYGELNALWKLDKDDPQRIARWEDAVAGAISPPQAMLALSVDMLRLCKSLISTTNKQLKSDLGVAAVLAQASARAAAWNVRINIPLLKDEQQPKVEADVVNMLEAATQLSDTIESGCQ